MTARWPAAQSVGLERATWQHDIGVTATAGGVIESPTEPLGAGEDEVVAFRWVPGAEGWVGVVRRVDGTVEDAGVEWFKVDPCLVTHVLGAYDEGDGLVLYVCCYPAPEKGSLSIGRARWLDPPASAWV